METMENMNESISQNNDIDYTTEITQILQLNILAVALLFIIVLKGK